MEQVIVDKVNSLSEAEAKAALLKAIRKMESALNCRVCPINKTCIRTAEGCRGHILDELRENENVS